MGENDTTVDNVSIWMKPFFLVYGYFFGLLIYGYSVLLHFTCRIEHQGVEHYESVDNAIMALWHENNFSYFAVFIRHLRPHVWINHPAWYMKPVHILIKLLGVKKIILGSSGSGGREAANQLVEYLKRGYSTHINPDGPAGPPKVARKGALHMAAQSGVPIIALHFETPVCLRLSKTWDTKRLPLPFSKIIVHHSSPILVSRDVNSSYDEFVSKLDGPLHGRPRRTC